MAEPAEIIAYKGFKKDFTCHGHQYEAGKTYTANGTVGSWRNSFHACENPFDVWSYYNMLDSRFAEVRLSGEMDTGYGEDTKITATTISVTAELTLPEFIQRGIQWLLRAINGAKKDDNSASISSRSDYTKISNNGDDAMIGSSGNYTQIGNSGDGVQIGNSGDDAQISNNGYRAQIGNSGNYTQISNNGNDVRIGSSGNSVRIVSSGDQVNIGNNGNGVQIGSSGTGAQIGSNGNYTRIGNSGDYAMIAASGSDSVIASAGDTTRARGTIGTWISLAEFVDGKCIGFATGCIGQDGLKPNTWYEAHGGKLVEADA